MNTSGNDGPSGPPALADHIILFGRVLRRAGLKVGSHQIMDAVRAVEHVGVQRRADVYQALFSALVQRREHVALFDQAFDLFWRAPSQLAEVLSTLLPRAPGPPPAPARQRHRARQALDEPDRDAPPKTGRQGEKEVEVELVATYSRGEVLHKKDFAAFTAEEVAAARAFLRELRWPIAPQATRRRSPRQQGRQLHLRATIRRSLRTRGELLHLRYQGKKQKQRPVVVLCDISGSMEPYARMLLHFMHAITGGMQRVECFVFGTRLTRITRQMRQRDVDDALAAVSGTVTDWSGGTRIGEALKAFNYDWLRRTLRSSGVVLLISDGCDRGDPDVLAREMERLAHSCYRLLWLNPLLAFDAYEPLTRGMQAALPYVDDLLPVHNLDSLERLGDVLSGIHTSHGQSWRRTYGWTLQPRPAG